jgi:hypothetical protein
MATLESIFDFDKNLHPRWKKRDTVVLVDLPSMYEVIRRNLIFKSKPPLIQQCVEYLKAKILKYYGLSTKIIWSKALDIDYTALSYCLNNPKTSLCQTLLFWTPSNTKPNSFSELCTKYYEHLKSSDVFFAELKPQESLLYTTEINKTGAKKQYLADIYSDTNWQNTNNAGLVQQDAHVHITNSPARLHMFLKKDEYKQCYIDCSIGEPHKIADIIEGIKTYTNQVDDMLYDDYIRVLRIFTPTITGDVVKFSPIDVNYFYLLMVMIVFRDPMHGFGNILTSSSDYYNETAYYKYAMWEDRYKREKWVKLVDNTIDKFGGVEMPRKACGDLTLLANADFSNTNYNENYLNVIKSAPTNYYILLNTETFTDKKNLVNTYLNARILYDLWKTDKTISEAIHKFENKFSYQLTKLHPIGVKPAVVDDLPANMNAYVHIFTRLLEYGAPLVEILTTLSKPIPYYITFSLNNPNQEKLKAFCEDCLNRPGIGFKSVSEWSYAFGIMVDATDDTDLSTDLGIKRIGIHILYEHLKMSPDDEQIIIYTPRFLPVRETAATIRQSETDLKLSGVRHYNPMISEIKSVCNTIDPFTTINPTLAAKLKEKPWNFEWYIPEKQEVLIPESNRPQSPEPVPTQQIPLPDETPPPKESIKPPVQKLVLKPDDEKIQEILLDNVLFNR